MGAPNDYLQYYELYHSNDYLCHYGVKGMKWGVRRYQDKTGKLTAAGKQHYSKGGKNKEQMGALAATALLYAIPTATWGGLLVTSLIAQNVSYARHEKQQKKNAVELFKPEDRHGLTPEDVINANPPMSPLTKKQFHSKANDIIKGLGGMHNASQIPNHVMNCPLAACTVELRKRGIKVTANEGIGRSPDIWEKWYKGCKVEKTKDLQFVKEYITKAPRGASGYLGIRYKDFSGGHAVHWTNPYRRWTKRMFLYYGTIY